jgi:copper transport protein
MAVATLTGGAALAHTELKATVPADAATIADAPANVELTFSEPVRLTALSIQKDGDNKQSLGPLPAANAETFSVPLPETVGDGHYVVAWRAMSEDTHVINGEFMFAVGAEGSHDAHVNHEETPAVDHGDDHGAAH